MITRLVALAIVLGSSLGAQRDTTDARVVIHVDSLDRATFSNVAELLQGRVAGLTITRDGDGGLHWYMRGHGSYSASAPLVRVDGVRLDVARPTTAELAGRPSQLDEIDIENVERVEVLSGPATAAAFGTGAAHGVVSIHTFKPRAQATAWRLFTAAGAIDDNVTYPDNYYRQGAVGSTGTTWQCTHILAASGGCTPTGPISTINPLESESPFERALAARVGGAVASMTGPIAWRGGATLDREGSTSGRLAAQRLHVRGAASLSPTSLVDATVRGYWTRGNADLPSPFGPSLLSQGLFARDPATWTGFVNPPSSDLTSSREALSASARWRMARWLEARLVLGASRLGDENNADFIENVSGSQLVATRQGERRLRDLTGRFELIATYATRGVSATSTVTVERNETRLEEEFRETVSRDGASSMRFFSSRFETDLTGIDVTQGLVLWNRARVAGGVRVDRVRLRDDDWHAPPYPHLSLAWDVRPFVPGMLGGVRLRGALGDAGNLPYAPLVFSGFLPDVPREPNVEVSREREAGIDVAGAYERVGLSVTWYTKRTSDVAGVTSPFQNPRYVSLEVLNRGIEGELRARVLERRNLRWDVLLSYAYNHNELRRVGGPPFTIPGALSRQYLVPSAPLAAHGTFEIAAIEDLNGDGALGDACRVDVGGCEVLLSPLRFHPAFPPTTASLATTFRIGGVTLGALIDHRGGHYRANVTNAARCLDACRAAYDPTAPLHEQARVASVQSGINESSVEDATFAKLREISLLFTAPARWADAFGASRLEFSLAGRNVVTWTDYSGLDPEAMSLSWIPLVSHDLTATPIPRRFSIRVMATRD